jgi:hypothetical protein
MWLSQAIVIGHCVVALNGPWAFHIGDDPRWADPAFDDSRWETVDLTPETGAHDPDVGLAGYVPGWTARGHPGYSGVAWYRLHVMVDHPAGDTIAFSGSTSVDDGYTVFVNGVRLGTEGAPYSIRPHYFVLAPFPSATVAIRVWAAASTVRGSPSDAGGIHIAPALGSIGAIRDRYSVQWSQTLWGYVVDGIEPIAFVLLAVLALALKHPWMSLALVLTAILRVNQVTFFWGHFETTTFYEALRAIIVPPIIGAWLMTWRAWCGIRIWPSVIGATVAFMYVLPAARIAAALLMLAIVITGRKQWLAGIAALLVSVGLFAPELSALHIPGIWFPFGVGVSRTQFAYAAFDLVLLALFAWTISTSLPETSPSTS